jgi:hypothetical protein
MENFAILQFRHHDLDLGASVTVYAEAITQQGLPETHEHLLRELLQWVDPNAPSRAHSLETLQQVLGIEYDILTDASVTGTVSEHIPFLYAVLGRVLNAGRGFRQAMRRYAYDAEQAHEDDMHQYMQERGCDRLEAVQLMEATAFERLQERQERVLNAIEAHLGEDPEDTETGPKH